MVATILSPAHMEDVNWALFFVVEILEEPDYYEEAEDV